MYVNKWFITNKVYVNTSNFQRIVGLKEAKSF